jgi:putative photosynthetic complex assembly protein
MGHATTPDAVPRGPLMAIAALVAMSIVAVAGVRMSGVGSTQMPPDSPVAVRDYRFVDRPDGSIGVIDADGGATVMEIEPGTNGFLRSTMRGLARERKRASIDAQVPFRLIAHSDGRLTLEDPATARRVDLGAFGPTNAAAFARLMQGVTR